MKKSIQNCIIMLIGFAIIVLLLSFHLMNALNNLLINYNWLTRSVNTLYNNTLPEKDIFFFGEGFDNFSLLVDVIMAIIIALVVLIVFLVVYWNEKS